MSPNRQHASDAPPEASTGLSRRGLLGGALAGGLAAVLPAAPAGASAAQTPSAPGASASTTTTTASAPADATTFFSDPGLNFQALFALGACAYNAAQPGEVLEAFDRVHARGDTYAAYYEEFLALGNHLAQAGDVAARWGRRVTARNCYLRAAMYLDQALFYTLASSRPTRAQEAAVYRQMERCFAAAAARFTPAFKPVAIPYERRTLPGWLLTPAGAAVRRPTIILNNGSDAQNIDMLVSGGLDALDRGWNALIFEGPGQGSNLFLHGIPFRPDWEQVITPIVTWLRGRPEVDKRRITLFGSSFGGYLVPRAAAFEHRLAGIAADPGTTNPFLSWEQNLPSAMLTLLAQGRRQEFNGYWTEVLPNLPANTRFDIAKRAEIYGNGTFYDQMRLARRFVMTRATARQIDAPAIIAQAEQEAYFPGQSKQLSDWLRVKKTLVTFTVTQGAQFHCEPMAPTIRNDAVLDWLGTNMRPTG